MMMQAQEGTIETLNAIPKEQIKRRLDDGQWTLVPINVEAACLRHLLCQPRRQYHRRSLRWFVAPHYYHARVAPSLRSMEQAGNTWMNGPQQPQILGAALPKGGGMTWMGPDED
uniref:Uncharacterized protein n=1 Tax=Haemonchus contortus TaxID=6289 RepID=A0A7I4Y1F2_HAECO